MPAVHPCEVPLHSLLRSYQDGTGYADCYVTDVPGSVSQEQFIEAFYTSPLFKVERFILRYLAASPSTDADVKQLARGKAATFAAWRVESQSAAELLLADITGRTRSWLMAVPHAGPSPGAGTHLYFGSAVLAREGRGAGKGGMGWRVHALMGFHRLYSRLLLSAAGRRVGGSPR